MSVQEAGMVETGLLTQRLSHTPGSLVVVGRSSFFERRVYHNIILLAYNSLIQSYSK
jgi:hypothetical protein